MKDVADFNNDFQKNIQDISDVTHVEQLDCCTRGLKPYIWKKYALKSTEASRKQCRMQNESKLRIDANATQND